MNTELQPEKWFQCGNRVLHSEYKNAGSCTCLGGGGGGEAKKKEIKEKEENKLKVYFENVVLLSKSIGPSKSLVGMCGI